MGKSKRRPLRRVKSKREMGKVWEEQEGTTKVEKS